jgi:anaerobic selenocysteine-containing dehydrogenase
MPTVYEHCELAVSGVAIYGMTDTANRTVFRTCPLCEATCGLEISVNPQEQIVRIRGDQKDVFSHGFICPKGSTLKQLHEDPDRLRMPMVKRDGKHVEVSWDEAWKVVAEGLLA